MRPWRNRLAVAMLSSAAVAGGFFGGLTLLDRVNFARAESAVELSRQHLANADDLSSVFRDVDKVMEPSVVRIDVTKTIKVPTTDMPNDFLRRFFQDRGQDTPAPQAPDNNGDNGEGNGGNGGAGGEQDQEEDGTGSGVIMEVADGYGYILTNNHVAGDTSELTITLADGRVIKHGHLMGADPKTDLAVVRIKADDLIAARWGNSDDLQKGDWILAFGCPLGYTGTMTHGIVSALDRSDVGIINNGQGYEHFIQVDAPINPGNSGGPLVNLHGEVVGINTAIASRSGLYSGIGFAIPSDQAHKIYETLKAGNKVVRGYLGVGIRNVADYLPVTHSLGYGAESGILVTDVYPGTPVYGKLQSQDIITAYGGKSVKTTEELRNEVAGTTPGTAVKLTIFRDGHSSDVTVTVGTQPDDLTAMIPGHGGAAPDPQQEVQPDIAKLGLELKTMRPEIARQLGFDPGVRGAVITDVKVGSIAAKARLEVGFVITHVGKTAVANATEASAALSRADMNVGVRLTIQTPQGSDFVFMQQDDPSKSNN